MFNLIATEAWKISYDNGFYWWELTNSRIERARIELFEAANIFWKHMITEPQFHVALQRYFQVIYEESDAAWRLKYLSQPLEDSTPLPIDCVSIHYRECNFITERLSNWLFKEGEPVWDVEKFHSRFSELGEQDYSHVELPGVGKDYVFTWGKWGKPHLQKTLGWVIENDPEYLVWILTNTEKLSTLSNELRKEIVDNLSTQKRGR